MNDDRHTRIMAFLKNAGWGDARIAPLAGDASLRRYMRLSRDGATAILMDAPPATGEDVRPFVSLGERLHRHGLSTPDIMAKDTKQGFLLLEDLGDDLLARHAKTYPGDEPMLYAAATEALVHLQHVTPPPLPDYRDQMPDLAATVFDWYAPDAHDRRTTFLEAMTETVTRVLAGPTVLVHRDYHAENLLWLPGREGAARVGLLDFQDAMLGPAEYDLASLIHDPRRPVSDAARKAATETFLTQTGTDPDIAAARIAVCSVQRSLRIIGKVFTRLCLHSGRTTYLRFIPPTWVALQRELQHPALAPVRTVLNGALPEPTPDWLRDIEARAGTLEGRASAIPA